MAGAVLLAVIGVVTKRAMVTRIGHFIGAGVYLLVSAYLLIDNPTKITAPGAFRVIDEVYRIAWWWVPGALVTPILGVIELMRWCKDKKTDASATTSEDAAWQARLNAERGFQAPTP